MPRHDDFDHGFENLKTDIENSLDAKYMISLSSDGTENTAPQDNTTASRPRSNAVVTNFFKPKIASHTKNKSASTKPSAKKIAARLENQTPTSSWPQ